MTSVEQSVDCSDMYRAMLPVHLRSGMAGSSGDAALSLTVYKSYYCCPLRATAHQAHYRDYGQMTYARALFVIHNIAHQGRGP